MLTVFFISNNVFRNKTEKWHQISSSNSGVKMRSTMKNKWWTDAPQKPTFWLNILSSYVMVKRFIHVHKPASHAWSMVLYPKWNAGSNVFTSWDPWTMSTLLPAREKNRNIKTLHLSCIPTMLILLWFRVYFENVLKQLNTLLW